AALVELVRDVALRLRHGARARLHVGRDALAAPLRARLLHEALHLSVERTLLLCERLQLRQQLGQPGRRFRGARAIAGERRRRLAQRVRRVGHRLRGLARGARIARVPCSLRDFLFRVAHRAGRARRHQRGTLRLRPEPLRRLGHALLQRALLAAKVRIGRVLLRLVGEAVLLARELQHLLQRLVELASQFLLPLVHLLLAAFAKRLRRALHRIGGLVRSLRFALRRSLLTGLWLAARLALRTRLATPLAP